MAFGHHKAVSVRPVKKKKEKLVKPNVNELKRIYRALSRQADWTNLDTICTAMLWWDKAAIWIDRTVREPSSKQANFLVKALRERREGNRSLTDKDKLQHYVNMIRYMERVVLGYLKVPKIEEAVKKSQGFRIKLEKIRSKMAPKFRKLTTLLHAMFPTCPLEIEVVPYLRASDGVEIPRLIDHAVGKMRYSREHARSLISLIRNEGLLACAIQESFFLARGMSFEKLGDGSFKVDHKRWLEHHAVLLSGFLTWAKREDTPKRLVKKVAKRKIKVKIKNNHSETVKKGSISEPTNVEMEAL